MQRLTRTVFAMLLTLALFTPSAIAWDRGAVQTFATLPAGAAHPEGITVDAAGNVYVTTFDVSKASGPGTLLVFGPNGQLLRQVAIVGSTNLLLDLAFHPTTGALLLLGPAWLKVRFGVDEVVTTLLLNFIVLLFVSAMLDGPMKDPSALGWPQSVAIAEPLQLDKLIPRSRVHSGLLVALVLAVALTLLLRHTTLGFEIRAVGANPRAAAFAGMPVRAVVWKVALLSGALAGLAGAVEVAGRAGYVTLDMSPGYGYSGIVVAMLAGLHPIGVVVAAVFVAGMLVGADSMSRAVGVPTYIADVIVAVALVAVLVATLGVRWRVRWR